MNNHGGNFWALTLKIILNIFYFIGIFVFIFMIISSTYSIIHTANILNIILTILILLIIFSILSIIFCLRKIINSIIENNPFSLSNVKYFRWIGGNILIIGVILLSKDVYYSGLDAFTILDVYDDTINTNIDIFIPFIAGIFSLILAEIFKIGHRISKENELTI